LGRPISRAVIAAGLLAVDPSRWNAPG
jgi:hypothetical protein